MRVAAGRVLIQQLPTPRRVINSRPRVAARVCCAMPPSASPPSPTEAAALWASVVERYDHAQAARAATLTDTTTEVLEDGGVRFVLRVVAALRDKPKAPPGGGGGQAQAKAAQWRNPFLPPDADLFVRHLSPSHSLVLNKFNIVPHHALVVTRRFERQEAPLTAADLGATWAAMGAMPRGGLAYFNCGPLSGASQPHKHLQVVPLPLLPPPAADGADPPFWPALAAATAGAAAWCDVVEPEALPFASFVVRLDPASASGEALQAAYARLMQRMHTFVAAAQPEAAASAPEEGATEPPTVSHNLVMTRLFMMAVPRRREGDGPVSCNAMAFAGSFFVRSAEELAHVRAAGPMHILAAVGFPRGG
jgi:ATP adenylyltransferase